MIINNVLLNKQFYYLHSNIDKRDVKTDVGDYIFLAANYLFYDKIKYKKALKILIL